MLALHNILNGIWMMDAAFANNYIPLVASFIKGERLQVASSRISDNEEEITCNNGIALAMIQNDSYVISEYGRFGRPEDAPENSLAIIYITDAITKHDQECGPSGMQTKSDLLKRCYANERISSVVLVIDSGGGEGRAMRLMAETIGQRNKPVGAFIDDFCCSAAYGIASACDYVCANSALAEIGSIGTYITLVDYTERFKLLGINIQEIYATASTDKNKEFRDAIAGKPEALIAYVDNFNEYFLSMIESNRGDKLQGDRKVWGTGKTWNAGKSLELGIIDSVDTFENFINYFNS